MRAATHEAVNAHFVGSIVYIQEGIYQTTALPQLLVIDGQQRLTTLTLILTALAQAAQKASATLSVSAEEIIDYYLLNRHGKGDLRYKLDLTQTDRDTLQAIVTGKALPTPYAPRLAQNYAFFVDQIRKAEVDLDTLYQGIGKLVVVDIALDREHDNPQLIFESLNSTGLALSQADLIRNYILMRLDPDTQQALYIDHWFPMEQLFGPDFAKHFDRFMRDYLTITSHSGAIPRIDDVYRTFKLYHEILRDKQDITLLVAEIHDYARLFANATMLHISSSGEPDKAIRAALEDISALEVDVAYPFLLEAYHDYTCQKLAREDFIAILRLIESYVFRRAICNIPTTSMNKTFATLMRAVDKYHYLATVERALMALPTYRRFPRDDEFRREFSAKDVYNFQRRKYLLRKLENHNRKERVIIDGFTSEHIMPQNPNLAASWQADLGPQWQEIQARYLHTIGNLTLTGYNSEMSDRAFLEKRDMPEGFAHSPLHLNEGLGQLDHWNEQTMQERARLLADRAVVAWSAPQDIRQTSEKADRRNVTIALERYEQLTLPTTWKLFMDLRQRILHLEANVHETYFKGGIAFRSRKQFAWAGAHPTHISIGFSARLAEIDDPEHLCQVDSDYKKNGRNWISIHVKSAEQVDYVMYLIEQSLLLRQAVKSSHLDPWQYVGESDKEADELLQVKSKKEFRHM